AASTSPPTCPQDRHLHGSFCAANRTADLYSQTCWKGPRGSGRIAIPRPLAHLTHQGALMSKPARSGLDALRRPQESVLVMIDHQPYQLANLNSHDPHIVVNNATALAKAAKAFDVPTILTSVVQDRGGFIFPQITGVFPDQEVIDRTFINTWEDRRVVEAVRATGRKQLVIAGLWTEVCVAMPTIQALGEGWDVTVVTDAPGGVSLEAHRVAIQRMIAAGANVMTWLALAAEWQRDWARMNTVVG